AKPGLRKPQPSAPIFLGPGALGIVLRVRRLAQVQGIVVGHHAHTSNYASGSLIIERGYVRSVKGGVLDSLARLCSTGGKRTSLRRRALVNALGHWPIPLPFTNAAWLRHKLSGCACR